MSSVATKKSVDLFGRHFQWKLGFSGKCKLDDFLERVIDSLQLTAYKKVATPANWKKGEDVVISPSVSNEEAEKLFPKGFKEVKPYLRMTSQPED